MQRRKEKHIKQSEIAEMLNVSENQISNIENGKSFPRLQNFLKLCESPVNLWLTTAVIL